METDIKIDCGETVPLDELDLNSSALDNVKRAQRYDPIRSFNLSEVVLYGECPVAKLGKLKTVHIDLAPNMTRVDDQDLAAQTLENAAMHILDTSEFICTPFRVSCPKGFK